MHLRFRNHRRIQIAPEGKTLQCDHCTLFIEDTARFLVRSAASRDRRNPLGSVDTESNALLQIVMQSEETPSSRHSYSAKA